MTHSASGSAAENRELELKFAIGKDDTMALRDHRLVKGLEYTIQREQSDYYDTIGARLYDAGFLLRVRNANGELTQTIKQFRPNGCGIMDRGEWQCAIGHHSPDLEAAAATPLAHLLSDRVTHDALGVRFSTSVDRTCWRIESADAQLALTLDEGELIAGRATLPICELELELISGSNDALFATAASLAENIRLWPVFESKADRGVALLRATGLRPAKAEPVALRPEIDVAEAACCIIANCIEHLSANVLLFIDEPDPDVLHQAHVATRRLRTAMRLFQPIMANERADRWRETRTTFQTLSRLLGEARDADILISRFGNCSSSYPHLALRRDVACTRITAHLRDPDIGYALIDMFAQLRVRTGPEATMSIDTFVGPCFDRLRKALVRAGRKASEGSPDDLHHMRIAAKRLRYACDFFRSLYQQKRQRRQYGTIVRALEKLHSALGDLNDLHNAAIFAGENAAIDAALAEKLLQTSRKAFSKLCKAKRFWR